MSPGRRLWIVTFIAALLAAHAVAIVGRIDQWPLSNYPMFAQRKEGTVTWLVLKGITDGGAEIRLDEPGYWYPYSSAKLAQCLRDAKRQAARAKDARPADSPALAATIESLLAHYESRRLAGLHRGPRVAGLLLYSCQWQIDPHLANLQCPDRQELVCEYSPGF